LAIRYDVDTDQANRVHSTALTLFKKCVDDWKLNKQQLESMLGWATLLHEVGLQINSRGLQRHGAYILENIDMPGFNQEEQLLLATLVRFQRKKIREVDIPEFDQFSSSAVVRLLVIVRLSVLLNIKRQEDILPAFKLSAVNNQLKLTFKGDWLSNKPIFAADLAHERVYLKAIGIELLCQ
jgi:exopolyphosphatase/guanosine-5'-triphosphate,3'-diphosphate pyrophosphatase